MGTFQTIRNGLTASLLALAMLPATAQVTVMADSASVEETYDEAIAKNCKAILKNGMKGIDGTYGQVAVTDMQTGQLKAWVTATKNNNERKYGHPTAKAFTPRVMAVAKIAAAVGNAGIALNDSVDVNGGICHVNDSVSIRDHNWRSGGYGTMTIREALVKKSNVGMFLMLRKCMEEKLNKDEHLHLYSFSLYDAMHQSMEKKTVDMWRMLASEEESTNAANMATDFSALYVGRAWVDLNGNLTITQGAPPASESALTVLHGIMTGLNTGDGLQAHYAPEAVSIAGAYGSYHGEGKEAEMAFVGCVPADNPRYAVSVCIKLPNKPVHWNGDLARSIVNDLMTWLYAH